jgi:hypothetical protein
MGEIERLVLRQLADWNSPEWSFVRNGFGEAD